MPTVSRLPFEAHPFTIANMPGSNDGNAVFIVRARDGRLDYAILFPDAKRSTIVQVSLSA
jgi:hypothetical protein